MSETPRQLPSQAPGSTGLRANAADIDGSVVDCRLFVAGDSAYSQQALANLARVQSTCDLPLQVRVIDIHQHPEQAISEQIVCTPSLIIRRNFQEYRLVGNLSDQAVLLEALGVDPARALRVPVGVVDASALHGAASTGDYTIGENDCTVDYLRRRVAQLEQLLLAIRQSQLAALWADDLSRAPELPGREADRLYCRMIEAMAAGVVLFSADHTVLYANQQAARLLDRSRSALSGRPLQCFLTPECCEALLAIQPGTTRRVSLLVNGGEPVSVPVLVSSFLIPMRPFSLHGQLWQAEETEAPIQPDQPNRCTDHRASASCVSLVAAQPDHSANAGPVQAAAAGEGASRRRLLLVGAGVDTARALALLSRHHRYDTRIAQDAAEAHAVLEAFTPDVLCLDIDGADGSGFAVHRAILDRLEGVRPVCVALSCGGKGAESDRFIAAGFAAHFTKPFNASELFATLDTLLGQA